MPQPTASDFHVNVPLTNISVAYIQRADHFIAGKAFPRVPVTKQSDRYYRYDKGDWFRDEAQKRADATESAGSGYNVSSTDTYFCDVEAFHKDIGPQAKANADSVFNLETDATKFVTQRLLVRQEVEWVNTYFSTGVWATEDGSTAAWSDYTNGDPIGDMEDGKQSILGVTGFEPNTLIMGYAAWRAIKHHPDIIERVKYTGGPDSDVKKALADLFEIENIMIAKSIRNTAKEGQTASFQFNHGGKALLAYVNPEPGLLVPSAGYNFVWTGVSGGLGADIGIDSFEMRELGPAQRVEGQIANDFKVIADDLGYFFPTASTF